MSVRLCAVFVVAIVAAFALAERASAFGAPGAFAPLAQAAPSDLVAASWCGWKCRPVTPQYFRYRPPSLAARCFTAHYTGEVYCPYAERPYWWRGCWMGRDGRKVCRNPGLFW